MPKRIVFSDGEQQEIARRYRAGESHRDIAARFGVGHMTIYRVLRKAGLIQEKAANSNLYEDFLSRVALAFPGATVGEDADGQIVIYTNLKRQTQTLTTVHPISPAE